MTLLLQTPAAVLSRLHRTLRPGTPSPLLGATVLITGASSGIGEHTAYAAAARGAHVLLVARRADELARVAAEVVARGGRASTYPLDLTDGDAVDALVAHLLTRHGAVDYLVNNAGRSIRRSLELSHDRFHDFERMMAVNFFGPVRLTMGLLPAMREQKFGHVVNIVTWGNQIKAPKFAAYIAAKSALDVFGRIMGREAFFDNVTCTNVRVSLVATDMIAPTDAYSGRRAESPEQIVRALEDRPITVNGFIGSISEVFNLVAPRLSDFVFAEMSRRLPDSAAARGEAAVPAVSQPHS